MRFLITVAVVVQLSLLSTLVASEVSQKDLQLHPSTPRRGRFLGLLGLLTGLSLVDSFDDNEPRFRPPAGIVKINIGRPESYYQYAYNPYYYGAVPTINIKIPIRPDGGHDGFDGAAFGGSFGQPGQFGSHVTTNLIEPRPTFADPVAESSSAESTEETPKKSRIIKKSKRSKIPSTRIIRSTLRSDTTDDQMAEDENQLETSTLELSDPTETNPSTTEEPLMLHGTAIPIIEDNSITSQRPSQPIELADFPQPISQSYFQHSGSLQDPSEISLTTVEPFDPSSFRASLPDHLQNYHVTHPDEFRPIVSV
ncbi:uncharacterized protein LOC135706410 [Ochlerotatus camptorhynchus]|uniref:uncharacterized protein LOC135706410 n=1 Tax=Ochlerotatus camptorhynchus TaxID=644619 RepID=UPI0031DC61CC